MKNKMQTPELVWLDNKKQEKILVKTWHCELPNGDTLLVYPGISTDGMSAPEFTHAIMGDNWDSEMLPIAFMHDCLFKIHAYNNRELCDWLMLETMEQQGISWLYRNTVYSALTMFSSESWEHYNETYLINRNLIHLHKKHKKENSNMYELGAKIGAKLIEAGVKNINTKPLQDEILDTVQKFKEARADGDISWSDIMDVIAELGQDIVAVIKAKSDMSENQLAETLVAILKEVYFSPEGFNNPSITFLPDWVEDHIEDFLFEYVLPFSLKFIISAV